MDLKPTIPSEVQRILGSDGEISEILARLRVRMPGATIRFDTDTYTDFSVVRVEVRDMAHALEPLLFGDVLHLSELNRHLWELSSAEWTEEMTDISQRGTFLKRVILLPAVLQSVRAYTPAGHRVLDLGCGEGVLIPDLLSITPEVYACDFAPAFVARLRREFSSIAEHFSVQDATRLGYYDAFDTVVACALLLGIPDVTRALDGIYNAVRPGGVAVIADINSRHHRCLGYFDDAGTLVIIHDPGRVFHIEKHVGGGRTRAIHNHHPFSLYRDYLEKCGMRCLIDTELTVKEADLSADAGLDDTSRHRLLLQLRTDMRYSPFHLLVLRKPE